MKIPGLATLVAIALTAVAAIAQQPDQPDALTQQMQMHYVHDHAEQGPNSDNANYNAYLAEYNQYVSRHSAWVSEYATYQQYKTLAADAMQDADDKWEAAHACSTDGIHIISRSLEELWWEWQPEQGDTPFDVGFELFCNNYDTNGAFQTYYAEWKTAANNWTGHAASRDQSASLLVGDMTANPPVIGLQREVRLFTFVGTPPTYMDAGTLSVAYSLYWVGVDD